MSAIIRSAVFVLCLVPLFLLGLDAWTSGLGTNPVETVTHFTGDWTLRMLLLVLTMTPLRVLSASVWPLRLRRMLGLFAFFYAVLHLLTYLWMDQFFDWAEILVDIGKRPFITVGFLGFVLMVPLAVTSTNYMMKRLGRYWKRLHRLVYVTAVLGVVHFLWLVKADLREPLVYAGLLAVLLGFRAVRAGGFRRRPVAANPAARWPKIM